MINSHWRLYVVMLSVAVSGMAMSPISRGAIIMELDDEFSGGTNPAGPTPWLTAIFQDFGAGTVRLTMDAAGLTGTEFVSEWSFNLNPALVPTSLVFTPVDISDVGSPTINLGVDAFQADGDGNFDIQLDFPTSGSGGGAMRFTSGESVVYDITYGGVGTFNESSFNFVSAPGGGNGSFHTAAHVQGIGASGSFSGWIGNESPPRVETGSDPVPESATFVIWSMLIAITGLVTSRRRVSSGLAAT
jgi:hypothetical protein